MQNYYDVLVLHIHECCFEVYYERTCGVTKKHLWLIDFVVTHSQYVA